MGVIGLRVSLRCFQQDFDRGLRRERPRLSGHWSAGMVSRPGIVCPEGSLSAAEFRKLRGRTRVGSYFRVRGHCRAKNTFEHAHRFFAQLQARKMFLRRHFLHEVFGEEPNVSTRWRNGGSWMRTTFSR